MCVPRQLSSIGLPESVIPPGSESERNTDAVGEGAQTAHPWESRVSASLIVALTSLLIGGWVFIWNGDGGGPFPVALIGPWPASLPYVLPVVALVAHLLRLRFPFVRWFVPAFAVSAALATLWFRHIVLGDADSINRHRVPEGDVVGVENALTRAVSGQLTEVDPTVFSVLWVVAATCLVIGAVAAGISLWQDQRRT